MPATRLSAPTGSITFGTPNVIAPDILERDAVFCYEGTFIDMDGNKVKVTADKLKRLADNHNLKYQLSLAGAVAAGKQQVDPADCPPVQVDHSTSGWDTVGRIFGMLRLVDGYVPRPGAKPVVALAGPVRFLGEDNCKRASDGRWATLSTAADFDEGYFTELTVTPFPAAKSARLLKEGKMSRLGDGTIKVGSKMFSWSNNPNTGKIDMYDEDGEHIGVAPNVEAAKEFLKKQVAAGRLSEGDPMDKEKLKRHLTECKKMSAEDADKHLAALSDEDQKKLAAEADDEDKKKLAAEEDESKKKLAAEKDEADKKLAAEKEEDEKKLAAEDKEKEAKLSAASKVTRLAATAKTGFVKLAKQMRVSFKESRLESRKAGVVTRLSNLRAQAKLTPAETKKMDIAKLSAKTDTELESFFEGYEARESVVLVGQRGTANAEPVARLAKQHAKKTSKQERLSSMPFTARAVGKKHGVEVDADGNVKHVARFAEGEPMQAMAQPDGGEDKLRHLNSRFAESCKMLDEGKREDAMRNLKDWMMSVHSGDGSLPAESTARMSALAEQNKNLENQFEELVKMVAPVLEVADEDLA